MFSSELLLEINEIFGIRLISPFVTKVRALKRKSSTQIMLNGCDNVDMVMYITPWSGVLLLYRILRNVAVYQNSINPQTDRETELFAS